MYKIQLEVEGKSYPLMSSTINSYNRGSETPYSGDSTFTIQMKLVLADQFLMDWFLNAVGQKKSGKIIFLREDGFASLTLIFTEASAQQYSSNMSSQDGYGNDCNVTLTASNYKLQHLGSSVTPGTPPVK